MNRLPDVKRFVTSAVSGYANLRVKYKPGAPPILHVFGSGAAAQAFLTSGNTGSPAPAQTTADGTVAPADTTADLSPLKFDELHKLMEQHDIH